MLEASTELEYLTTGPGAERDVRDRKEKRDKERQKERAKVEKEKDSDEGTHSILPRALFFALLTLIPYFASS